MHCYKEIEQNFATHQIDTLKKNIQNPANNNTALASVVNTVKFHQTSFSNFQQKQLQKQKQRFQQLDVYCRIIVLVSGTQSPIEMVFAY